MSRLNYFTGETNEPDLTGWHELVAKQKATKTHKATVGLVAKYMDNEDTYISVLEALKAAAWWQDVDLTIKWINAETANDEDFAGVDGLLVPGGFGTRGVEGKIAAARYAIEHKKPYLGICLGLQVAVIAATRKAGLEGANSTEFDVNAAHNVVYIMDGQQGKESTGGTLRLGDYTAKLKPSSKIRDDYGADIVTERHRRGYEVKQKYLAEINAGGLDITGTSPDGKLVEYVEATDHPYFVATQSHPEFKSRPMRPHPLFTGLIRAAINSQ